MQNVSPPSCEHSPWVAAGEAEAAARAMAGVSSRIQTAAATPAGVRSRALLRGSEKLVHPAEELVQHHPGDAAEETLADARDETSNLDVAVAGDACTTGRIGQLDHRIATHEAWGTG